MTILSRQEGGIVRQTVRMAQDGTALSSSNLWKTNRNAFADSTLNANKNIEWVQRLYQRNTPSIQVPGYKYRSTHLMSDNGQGFVFPRVIDRGRGLEYIDSEDKAMNYAANTDTGIQFKTPEQGAWFAANGYKKGTGVLQGYEYKAGGKIRIKPENKGKFNATKKATGKSTEALTHSKNPKTKKRAIFAQNARKWKHRTGGLLSRPLAKKFITTGMIKGKPITYRQRDYFNSING